MTYPKVGTSFTIVKYPPRGGRYVAFHQTGLDPSPLDRVHFFCFASSPGGFDEDIMFDSVSKTWTLNSSYIMEVFLDHRDDLPIFTIVEKREKYCRLAQIGGTRQTQELHQLWFSAEMLNRAIAYGTLELLS